jgi:hydrogenase maturation protease
VTRTRVIALGQTAAGDDGVGLAVLEELRRGGVPEGVELVHAPEDGALITLLETPATVVLVDAVVGGRPGEVLEVGPEELEAKGLRPISTHGLGTAQAIALACAVAPATVAPAIRIVGITIAAPARYVQALSPIVAAAVPAAAARVRALMEEEPGRAPPRDGSPSPAS